MKKIKPKTSWNKDEVTLLIIQFAMDFNDKDGNLKMIREWANKNLK